MAELRTPYFLVDEERLVRAGEEARAYMVGAVNRLRARQGLPPVRLEPPEEPGALQLFTF